MFEESPLFIDVLAFASHKGNCFEEIVAEPLAIIRGDYEFLSIFKLWNKSSLS